MMRKLYDYSGADLHIDDYITPEMYGAVGDGIANDTAAIQSAINHGGLVRFMTGANYKVTDTLRTGGNTFIDLNGSTITSTAKHLLYNFLSTSTFTGYSGNGNITVCDGTIVGGSFSLAHAENVLLKNLKFFNSLNDHFLEICACKNYVVDGCSFIGMADVKTSVYEYINIDPCTHGAFPWLPDGSAFYDGTKNRGITVRNCYFAIGENVYAYGFNAIGVHGNADAQHEDINILESIMRGFTGCGIRVNDMQRVSIRGCDIRVSGDGIRVGDVAACDDVVIVDNFVISENGDKLAVTDGQCTNLTVAGNVAKGERQEF